MLLAEVGKRGRGKGERFGILPFPNKDASLFPQECKKQLIAIGLIGNRQWVIACYMLPFGLKNNLTFRENSNY
jgi:hypothetical protein